MKIVRGKICLTMLVVFMALSIGCAYKVSFVKTSYDILTVSNATYDTAMKALASLDRQGILSKHDKTKALEYGRDYYNAHNAAVEALAEYKESNSSGNGEALEKQLALTSKALLALLKIIKPYLMEE